MERNGTAPPDDLPVALVREGPHGPVIHDTNRAARLHGITLSARVADMRALCPDLQIDYADVAGDRAALDRLVLWARRWCPWTNRDGDDGLILDTTGADHLLGGEAAMLVDMETQLSLLGLSAELAVAPTWGAAWALARLGPVRALCPDGQTEDQIRPLPVTGLRLTGDTVVLLQRLGLKTIGALMDVPRLSLTRRFVRASLEANPLMRLDQALGKMAEPVSSVEAAQRFRAHSTLPEPIFDPTPYLPDLCMDICTQLHQAGQACRHVHLTVYRTDGDVSHVTASTAAASRDPAHLLSLFRDKVAQINPGFGFDLITLDAAAIEPLSPEQARLDGGQDDTRHLAQLIDRLSAKFGARAVTRPALHQSHVPERAQHGPHALHTDLAVKPAVAVASQPTATPALRDRPLRLLSPPEEVRVLYAVPEGPPAQFVWRRQTHRVTRYAGPERIAPEWWHDRPSTRLRDYFKIENQSGQRIWMYREGLHDDGRGGDPRWFVHGCFA